MYEFECLVCILPECKHGLGIHQRFTNHNNDNNNGHKIKNNTNVMFIKDYTPD